MSTKKPRCRKHEPERESDSVSNCIHCDAHIEPVECSACSGCGVTEDTMDDCPKCNGSGISKWRRLTS